MIFHFVELIFRTLPHAWMSVWPWVTTGASQEILRGFTRTFTHLGSRALRVLLLEQCGSPKEAGTADRSLQDMCTRRIQLVMETHRE